MSGKQVDTDTKTTSPAVGATTKMRVISTGNTEIDKKMGGGIPLGSMTLV